MSVNDPLLKALKYHVLNLRLSNEGSVSDHHTLVQPLCEILESIFRKGLKQSSSMLRLNNRDYWDIFRYIQDAKVQFNQQISQQNRCSSRPSVMLLSPKFDEAIEEVKKSRRVFSGQGRGRLMLRCLIMKKQISWTVNALVHILKTAEEYYDDLYSILGNEILAEIFLSLLRELDNVHFQLNLKNASFLDATWLLPIVHEEQFVPCKALGLELLILDDFLVVEKVLPGTVADEDSKVKPGDILDELCGVPLKRNFVNLRDIVRSNAGKPITCVLIKATAHTISPKESDNNNAVQVYPPLLHLLKKNGKGNLLHMYFPPSPPNHSESTNANTLLNNTQIYSDLRHILPPAVILNELFPKESPNDSTTMPPYQIVRYVGECFIGSDGGVYKIEGGIYEVLKTYRDPLQYTNVKMHLGEKDVSVSQLKSNKEESSQLFSHAFPQISSCGRRMDCDQFFAYIAGESTCTISKEFHCYVFQARNSEESKKILCSIAQGFERTHWAL